LRPPLDEDVSPEIARQPRDRGHDVVAVGERSDLRGRSDRVHFASLPDERRAIVTRDLGDFRSLLAAALRSGYSGPRVKPGTEIERTKGARVQTKRRPRGNVHDVRPRPGQLAEPAVIGLDLGREPDEVGDPFPRVRHLEALTCLLGEALEVLGGQPRGGRKR
jgi:Domain of unknown function (DUF5615)